MQCKVDLVFQTECDVKIAKFSM